MGKGPFESIEQWTLVPSLEAVLRNDVLNARMHCYIICDSRYEVLSDNRPHKKPTHRMQAIASHPPVT